MTSSWKRDSAAAAAAVAAAAAAAASAVASAAMYNVARRPEKVTSRKNPDDMVFMSRVPLLLLL